MTSDLETRIEEMTREARNDPRSVWELISAALTEQDADAAWEPVAIMHRRGTRDVLEAALSLARGACPVERTLGANILGQLGIPDRTFPAECVASLLAMLPEETDVGVLDAVCVALGHQHDPAAIPVLARLAAHPDGDVRQSVAYGLAGYDDPVAIETLIRLATDRGASVRDWAMFALGTQIDADTPAIRNALFRGMTDEDMAVRGEAISGLARRGDERMIEPLIRELARHAASDYDFCLIEAAEEIASPKLLPILTRLKESINDDRFDKAIRRSSVPGP